MHSQCASLVLDECPFLSLYLRTFFSHFNCWLLIFFSLCFFSLFVVSLSLPSLVLSHWVCVKQTTNWCVYSYKEEVQFVRKETVMGVGGSREPSSSQARRQAQSARQNSPSGRRRRRGFFGRVRPAPTTEPLVTTRHHISRPHHVHTRIPNYVRPHHIRPASLPPYYNRQVPFAYYPAQQPFFVPPRAYQPMMMPQQIPVPPAMIIPQPAVRPQPMMMPQSIVPPQMYMMPQQTPAQAPIFSSPTRMAQPAWAGYAPPVQSFYNNIPASIPAQVSMPAGSYRSPYSVATRNLFTDWTGGGIISPGFLGPPI